MASNSAAMSYWQELFHNDKLSPPEYKYLFPDLNNVANEAVKELLTSKLTEEMGLMEETEWAGQHAVGQTAFWLKVLSEPRIGQLRKCKLEYIRRVMDRLIGTDLIPTTDDEDGVTTEIKEETDEVMSSDDNQTAPTIDMSHLNEADGLGSPTTTATNSVLSDQFNLHSSTPPSSLTKSLGLLPKLEHAPHFGLPMTPLMPSYTDMRLNAANFQSFYSNQLGSGESPIALSEAADTADPEEEEEVMSDMWTVSNSENGSMEFRCTTCHYKSTYKSRIKQHIRSVHSAVKPYKCDFCDHTTAVRASLTKHINAVHSKIKPFSCSLCTYTCSLKSSLDVHMAGVHQKSYRHKCPHCPYAAAAKNVVEIHIKAVHKREKPYKCPKPGCDYSSAYPQYIPKHIAAVHDRSKPFACPHCPYRSSYKAYLQKHCDAVHNNIKPHACPHCPYVTSYAQYLNKHISAVHKDEKPHKCPHCHFRCAYKQYISKHIELVHSGNAKSVAAVNDTLSTIGNKTHSGMNADSDVTSAAFPAVDNELSSKFKSSQVKPANQSAGIKTNETLVESRDTVNGVVPGSVLEFVNNNPDALQAAWPGMDC